MKWHALVALSLLALCPDAFAQSPAPEARTPVYRYWHAGDRDWVTIPGQGDQPTRESLLSGGYVEDTTPHYYVYLIGNPDLVAVYRWWQPDDKDWVDIADGSISDQALENSGYVSKTFQYYAFPTQVPGSVGIYRWWNAGDRDWVTLADGEIPDDAMTNSGYVSKSLIAYAYPSGSPD